MRTRLPLITKWIYGSGDLGFSLTATIINAYFAIFLTNVIGIKPGTVAAAFFIAKTWDYVNDPLIGFITDRTRSRWGRRRPFLLFGALPFALVFVLMWWRPPLESQVALAVYYALMYVLYDVGATFTYMPYFALTPELTQDYDERTSLTATRMFFSVFGSLLAFTIPLMIIGEFRPENAGRVLLMATIFAILSALPLLLVFFGTRERPEFMQQAQPGLKQALRSVWGNRPFGFGLGIFLFTWVAVNILETILLYFITYVVKREAQSDLIMATIFVTAILVLPLWNWVSKRMNKRWAYITGISFWALVQLVLASLNPGSSLGLILFLCILGGIGVSAAHVLTWALMPDAIEYSELKTGERHEGMFYSLITLAQKIASSLAVPGALLVLDLTGYQSKSLVQPDSAILGIRIVAGPIPAALLCAGILFAILYPLSRESYRKIAESLEEKRRIKPNL